MADVAPEKQSLVLGDVFHIMNRLKFPPDFTQESLFAKMFSAAFFEMNTGDYDAVCKVNFYLYTVWAKYSLSLVQHGME